MHINLDLSDAIAELMSYPDTLPDTLQHPAWLLAMEMEYGSRHVSRGRIRKMVERHLVYEHRQLVATDGYEPTPMPVRQRFEADVERIVKRLDVDPRKKKAVLYCKATRQFYHSPRKIADILHGEGQCWVTEKHVLAAFERVLNL